MDEAKSFHVSIIENRKTFFLTEIAEIKHQLAKIESQINAASEEHADLMKLLQTHGALEGFSLLQSRVYSRQRARALEYAHKRALEHNFQYICAINSDMIPYEDFEEGFEIGQFVRLTLGDKEP